MFDAKNLEDIEVKKTGWAFTFKKGNTFTSQLRLGGDGNEVKKIFPLSCSKNDDHIVQVFIGPSESSIIIKTKGNIITELSLFTDES